MHWRIVFQDVYVNLFCLDETTWKAELCIKINTKQTDNIDFRDNTFIQFISALFAIRNKETFNFLSCVKSQASVFLPRPCAWYYSIKHMHDMRHALCQLYQTQTDQFYCVQLLEYFIMSYLLIVCSLIKSWSIWNFLTIT